MFVGICRTQDAMRYLSTVPHGRFDQWHSGMSSGMGSDRRFSAYRSPTEPAEQGIRVESTSGVAPDQSGTIGRLKRIRRPRWRGSAATLPSCVSTTWRTMAKPSPEPGIDRARVDR